MGQKKRNWKHAAANNSSGAEPFLKKLTGARLVTKFSSCNETERSLPCSQQPANGHCPDPDKSRPHNISLRSINSNRCGKNPTLVHPVDILCMTHPVQSDFGLTFKCKCGIAPRVLGLCIVVVVLSMGWGHQRAYCSFPRWYTSMERHGGMILAG
jgi:hypothetical protein